MASQPHSINTRITYLTLSGNLSFFAEHFLVLGSFPQLGFSRHLHLKSFEPVCGHNICSWRWAAGGGGVAQRPGLHVRELKIRVRASWKNPLISKRVKLRIPSAIHLLRMSGSPVKLPTGQKGRGSGDIRTLLPSGWRRISNSGIVGKRDRKDCPAMRFQSTAGLEENRLADSRSL
jgi:hypothetical protein